MHGIPLLRDLVILVAVAIPVVLLMNRLKLPTIIGFLIAGVALGPSALGAIRNVEQVSVLAEIGVVLLLFAIGLELSLSRVIRMGRLVLTAGALQMVFTMAAAAIVAVVAQESPRRAVVWGLLIALSSTAIVLKLYQERGELDAPHGRVVVAILLFQDLCVVPLMLLLPLLAGDGGGATTTLTRTIMSVIVVSVLVGVGRWAVPWLLARVAAARVQELFTLSVVAIGLAAAYVTSAFGLSLALGAFLAGLIIAESEYGLQALSDMLPFRDAFTGIFFTSVGMLFDVRYLVRHPLLVLGVTLGLVLLKFSAGYAAVRIVRRSTRVGVMSGLGLAQVGEFSFVLASSALALGLFDTDRYQLFLGSSVLTMVAAPFLVRASDAASEWLLARRGAPTMEWSTREARAAGIVRDHVIIVGYGLNGRNLARALRAADIQYVVLEENAQVARRARMEREDVVFGDGTRGEVLHRVGAERARAIVFAIASLGETRRGVAAARRLNPAAHIVARTRYVKEVEELRQLGANSVVPEEFETSIELFTRVLELYGVAAPEIRRLAAELRRDMYSFLREIGHMPSRTQQQLSRLTAHLEFDDVAVRPGCAAAGKPLSELQLREHTGGGGGAHVVAVIRDGQAQYAPGEHFVVQLGDRVVLVGDRAALSRAAELFTTPVTTAV
ncbi:MAG: cation:proton antiporter domain-containing protein [Gemmatimonadaceae bacterium]